jgi:hypothetical protein
VRLDFMHVYWGSHTDFSSPPPPNWRLSSCRFAHPPLNAKLDMEILVVWGMGQVVFCTSCISRF